MDGQVQGPGPLVQRSRSNYAWNDRMSMESSVRVAVVVQVVSENDCCTHHFRAFEPPIVSTHPAREHSSE